MFLYYYRELPVPGRRTGRGDRLWSTRTSTPCLLL